MSARGARSRLRNSFEHEEALGRPIEVEVDAQRARKQDRAELVADPRLLQCATGWRPERSLQETLMDLLKPTSGAAVRREEPRLSREARA